MYIDLDRTVTLTIQAAHIVSFEDMIYATTRRGTLMQNSESNGLWLYLWLLTTVSTLPVALVAAVAVVVAVEHYHSHRTPCQAKKDLIVYCSFF